MFAFEVELLTGRYVATRHDDRDRPEWPPDPARLVFALVAAAGANRTALEKHALDWLCEQSPPAITFADAWARASVTAYVPVNDRAVPRDAQVAAGTVPRSRRGRTFPCMVPEDPLVTYVWPDATPSTDVREALTSLGRRLVYLGHSSTLVRVHVVEEAPAPTLVPGRGNGLLRVAAPGLVEALDGALSRYEATGVRGPLPTDHASYGIPVEDQHHEFARSVFGEMIVLRRTGGPRLPLGSAEMAALGLRAAVMSIIPDPVPACISGHENDGTPLDKPHVAFVALPDVGHPHSTGTVLGVAAVPPATLDESDRAALAEALAGIAELRLSPKILWQVTLSRHESERPPAAGLHPRTWSRPAYRLLTATPLELDRFVDDRLGAAAEEVVAESAMRIGLPRPTRVRLRPVSGLVGGGHIRDIRRRSRRPPRLLVHAMLDFDEPVAGPVLIGAGRYRGLGLCRPLDEP